MKTIFKMSEVRKADITAADINKENTTGQTTRKLTLSKYEAGKYTGVFIKEVKGVVKIDAAIQISLMGAGFDVTIESSRDRLRDRSFPADTRQSIAKQVNELFKSQTPVEAAASYVKFDGGELPQSALDFMEKAKGFRSGYGRWMEAWYKGDIATTDDWIIVMDDGEYYKVKAEFMTWYKSKKGEVYGKANWSIAALKRTLKALKANAEPPSDPNYHS